MRKPYRPARRLLPARTPIRLAPALLLSTLLSSTLLLLGCAAAGPTDWCPPLAVGVDVVASTGPGLWETAGATPRFVELWRAGGLREGEELAQPIHLAVSPTGRAAIPDFGLGEVVVIEPDGRWAGAWGGKGSGPGELTLPVAAAWGADGRLAVFDVVAPKVTILAGADLPEDRVIDPAFTAPVVSSGELHWAGVQPGGAALLQPSFLPVPDEMTTRGAASADADAADASAASSSTAPSARRAATITATGQRLALILRLPPGAAAPDTLARGLVRTIPEGRPFAGWALPGWPRPVAAVGPGGVLATGGEDASYRVVIHDEGGRPVRQLCRDAPALPLNAEESGRGEVPERLRELADAIRASPRPTAPATGALADAALAPYGRILLDADGRLWVQRERPSTFDAADALLGVAGARYDIFDAAGRYLGELSAPPRARVQAALGDTVWAFEVGDLDETTVVAYRVEGAGW